MIGAIAAGIVWGCLAASQETLVKKEVVQLPADSELLLTKAQSLYIYTDGTISAYDLRSMKPIWRSRIRTGYHRAEAKAFGDYLLVTLHKKFGTEGPNLVLACLSKKDGVLRWSRTALPNVHEVTGNETMVFARVSASDGVAINALTGEEIWRKPMIDRVGIIVPGPAPELLLVHDWLIRTYWDSVECYDAKTGLKLWTKRLYLAGDQRPLGTAKGVLLLEPSNRSLQLVAFKDGQKLWEVKNGEEPDVIHDAGGNWLGLRQNKLVIIDPVTGKLGPARTLKGVPSTTNWCNVYQGLRAEYKARGIAGRDRFIFDFRSRDLQADSEEQEDRSIVWSTASELIRMENGSLTRYARGNRFPN